MITVIVLHSEYPAIYKIPDRKTVIELMVHWISDTAQNVSPSSMKFLTLDGYTLTNGTFVQDIPLSDVDTRCVKALSCDLSPDAAAEESALALDTAAEDIAAIRERQLNQERQMRTAGLYLSLHPEETAANGEDDEDDVEVRSVAAEFHRTVFEYRQNVALRLGVPVESIRLRNGNDELLKDDKSLAAQGISPQTMLIIEKQREVLVHVVSRSYSHTKQVSVFKEQYVAETLLEANIPIEDQRLCLGGCRLSVSQGTTVLEMFGEDRFMSALPLETILVIREPVVLTRKRHQRMVSVWPEDVVSCLLEVEPDPEPVAPVLDRPPADRWALDKELITDVLFDDSGRMGGQSETLFYNCHELDATKTFAELALPPWAVICKDPLNVVFVKEYEFEVPLRVPLTASVADVKRWLLKERPALSSEDFQLTGPGRRFMSPLNTRLLQWGIKDGDRVIIEPIRVPQILLLGRR